MQVVAKHTSKKLRHIFLFDYVQNMHNQLVNNCMNITHLLLESFKGVICFLYYLYSNKEPFFEFVLYIFHLLKHLTL